MSGDGAMANIFSYLLHSIYIKSAILKGLGLFCLLLFAQPHLSLRTLESRSKCSTCILETHALPSDPLRGIGWFLMSPFSWILITICFHFIKTLKFQMSDLPWSKKTYWVINKAPQNNCTSNTYCKIKSSLWGKMVWWRKEKVQKRKLIKCILWG